MSEDPRLTRIRELCVLVDERFAAEIGANPELAEGVGAMALSLIVSVGYRDPGELLRILRLVSSRIGPLMTYVEGGGDPSAALDAMLSGAVSSAT